MKFLSIIIMLLCSVTHPAAAQETTFLDSLVDRFAGTWILQGTIAGSNTTHDVAAQWVLGHQYLQFREVSREKNEQGSPAYEAIVYIGWDRLTGSYACLWLDVTGGGGLSARTIGHAPKQDDSLAFVFTGDDGTRFHTTFLYDRKTDVWKWRMDAEEKGALAPFARLTMARK